MPIASNFQVMNLNMINMGSKGGVCSKEVKQKAVAMG
jgi:hypothetical protein